MPQRVGLMNTRALRFSYHYCQHPSIVSIFIIIKGYNGCSSGIFFCFALSFVCLFYLLLIYVHQELAIKLKANEKWHGKGFSPMVQLNF